MADVKTTAETTRSPIDGSEFVRLATSGANWKVTLDDLFAAMATSSGDPLLLTQGLTVNAFNPTYSGDANLRYAARIQLQTDNAQNNPTFGNNEALQIDLTAVHGQATNGTAANGGTTNAKTTFLPLNIGAIYNASGQKFLTNENIQSFGMSDTAIGQQFVTYAGGPVSGDEGQGYRLVCGLTQQQFFNTTTITAKPTQPTINTTTTQVITASRTPQAVSVASSAGCAVGDWVVIAQAVPEGSPNIEAVKITALTGTSITGIFLHNHPSGVSVTPALRISCVSTYQMGQDRVMVNLTAPSYSTGTVTAIAGGGMDFSGTALTNNIVGGNALNIGAISLRADDVTVYPFTTGAGALKSWYQITQVTSPTHLAIFSFSCAADGSYHGRGPGPSGSGAGGTGAYIIRPAVRVLRVMADPGSANVTGELICETVADHTKWNVGDSVEQTVCPYADVTGFQYHLSHYTPGGAGLRGFMSVVNTGARMMETGISIRNLGSFGQPSADTVAYGNAIGIDGLSNVAISIAFAQRCGISFRNGTSGSPSDTDEGNTIQWSSISNWPIGGVGIGPISANRGLGLKVQIDDSGAAFVPTTNGDLFFYGPGKGNNPVSAYGWQMSWGGSIYLPTIGGTQETSSITIDGWAGSGAWRFFMRAPGTTSAYAEIGTEQKNASGTNRDLVFSLDGFRPMVLRSNDHHIMFRADQVTPPTLNNNGEFNFTPTSNTNMRISYRGSDGVTRVGNITLA